MTALRASGSQRGLFRWVFLFVPDVPVASVLSAEGGVRQTLLVVR